MVNNNGDGNDCLEPQMDSFLHSSLQFSILYWLQQIRAWVNWHPTLVQTMERHVQAHVRYVFSICMCLSAHGNTRNFTNIHSLHGWSVSLFFLIYFLLKRHRLCYETMSQSFFFSSSRVVYLIVFPDPFSSVNKELECDFLHKLPDKHTPLSPELLHCYSVQYTKDNLLRWLSKHVFHPLINTMRLFSYKKYMPIKIWWMNVNGLFWKCTLQVYNKYEHSKQHPLCEGAGALCSKQNVICSKDMQWCKAVCLCVWV